MKITFHIEPEKLARGGGLTFDQIMELLVSAITYENLAADGETALIGEYGKDYGTLTVDGFEVFS